MERADADLVRQKGGQVPGSARRPRVGKVWEKNSKSFFDCPTVICAWGSGVRILGGLHHTGKEGVEESAEGLSEKQARSGRIMAPVCLRVKGCCDSASSSIKKKGGGKAGAAEIVELQLRAAASGGKEWRRCGDRVLQPPRIFRAGSLFCVSVRGTLDSTGSFTGGSGWQREMGEIGAIDMRLMA